ncbi:MAG: hypothetical protein U9N52_00355 [Campylobacterota bacterium]|nr:hypothetical protein [Campylobacterota bacterium]
MKPLTSSQIEVFNQRFDRAINGELRSLTIINPTTMLLRLSVQDEGRGFDWIDLELEISGVVDARLIDESKLSFLDMSEGISILFDANEILVSVGDYNTFEAGINAPLFIRGGTLKYQENNFSA